MTSGGNIIRLIDIVLILLFGFISISEISERSRVVLPKSTRTPPSPPDKEEIIIIGISEAGEFLVKNETTALRTTKALLQYLSTEKRKASRQNAALRVRVRPNWNTPIKYTMSVAAICDQLSLPKGLDVRRTGTGVR